MVHLHCREGNALESGSRQPSFVLRCWSLPISAWPCHDITRIAAVPGSKRMRRQYHEEVHPVRVQPSVSLTRFDRLPGRVLLTRARQEIIFQTPMPRASLLREAQRAFELAAGHIASSQPDFPLAGCDGDELSAVADNRAADSQIEPLSRIGRAGRDYCRPQILLIFHSLNPSLG